MEARQAATETDTPLLYADGPLSADGFSSRSPPRRSYPSRTKWRAALALEAGCVLPVPSPKEVRGVLEGPIWCSVPLLPMPHCSTVVMLLIIPRTDRSQGRATHRTDRSCVRCCQARCNVSSLCFRDLDRQGRPRQCGGKQKHRGAAGTLDS